jgi:hypothetical protein
VFGEQVGDLADAVADDGVVPLAARGDEADVGGDVREGQSASGTKPPVRRMLAMVE